jgi:translation elongation factor EF-G
MYLHAKSLFIPFGVHDLMGKKRQKPIKKYAKQYLKNVLGGDQRRTLPTKFVKVILQHAERNPYHTKVLETVRKKLETTEDSISLTPAEVKELRGISIETLDQATNILSLPEKPILLRTHHDF